VAGAFFCANWIVLRPAASAFLQKQEVARYRPRWQIVTWDVSLSAPRLRRAAAIVLTAARLRNFLLGRSAADVNVIRVTSNATSLDMRIILASFAWGLGRVDVLFLRAGCRGVDVSGAAEIIARL